MAFCPWPTKPKEDYLPIKKTDIGYVQQAGFMHHDLYHEEVSEIEDTSNIFVATKISAGTEVFTFLLMGDQNAGKSTFIHAFCCESDLNFLRLTSFLPILTSSFTNVRLSYMLGKTENGEPKPPIDELPYLDTDIARGSFLLTREAFFFMLDENGIDISTFTLHPDTRYVSVKFIEIGGDHLDLLMLEEEKAGSLSELAQDTRDRSTKLMRSAKDTAYFINAQSLLLEGKECEEDKGGQGGGEGGGEGEEKEGEGEGEGEGERKERDETKEQGEGEGEGGNEGDKKESTTTQQVLRAVDKEQWGLLVKRFAYINRTFGSGHRVIALVSRSLPEWRIDLKSMVNAMLEGCDISEPAKGRQLEQRFRRLAEYRVGKAFMETAATGQSDSGHVEETATSHSGELSWAELSVAIPVNECIEIALELTRQHCKWQTVFVGAYSADHLTSEGHYDQDALVGTIARLFQHKMVHSLAEPRAIAAKELMFAFKESLTNLDEKGRVELWMDSNSFREYLEDLEECCSTPIPALSIYEQFDEVSQELVECGVCLQRDTRVGGEAGSSVVHTGVRIRLQERPAPGVEVAPNQSFWPPALSSTPAGSSIPLEARQIRFPIDFQLLELIQSMFKKTLPALGKESLHIGSLTTSERSVCDSIAEQLKQRFKTAFQHFIGCLGPDEQSRHEEEEGELEGAWERCVLQLEDWVVLQAIIRHGTETTKATETTKPIALSAELTTVQWSRLRSFLKLEERETAPQGQACEFPEVGLELVVRE